jgi:DNA-binding CsgD family transcriptional regulator
MFDIACDDADCSVEACLAMKLGEFYDVMQTFSAAKTVEDITQLCQLHSKDLGFDNFIYALRVPTYFSDSKLVLIDGYPATWVDHYFEKTYQSVDPVMAYCAKHIVPIQWQNLKPLTEGAAKRMMDEAGDFGLKSGITMPVHSPRGEMGILSLTVNQSVKTALDVTESALPYIQIFAGYLHEAVRRVFGLIEDPEAPQLTNREQECLRWVADGKTSWEIAHMLNVSERTVNFHLNNVMSKLDVCSRQHAVGKAAFQGLIHPSPF